MLLSSDFRVLKQTSQESDDETVYLIQKSAREISALFSPVAQIVTQAQAEADQIRQTAYHEGFQQGLREGEKQAQALEAEARRLRSEAKDVLAQAEQLRADTLVELEPDILRLTVGIAQRLVEEQLSVAPETILTMVRSSLEPVRHRESYTIYLNPRDAEVLTKHIGELESQLSPGAQIRIISDSGITVGGCRTETERGVVDATVESKCRLLLEAFEKRG